MSKQRGLEWDRPLTHPEHWPIYDDDLSYVTNKLGDDFIVTATDFPHGDAFRQDQLAQGLKKRGDLSAQTREKILSQNPRRLYHIG